MKTSRYVEFIRVSSRGQADRDTPELQLRALARLADQRDGTLVERIHEEHVSGTLPLTQRPDLLRLKQLSQERAFDELRVYAIDRLTRSPDPQERMAVWTMVAEAGAVIVDTNGRVIDPVDESGFGELDYYLQSFFAAREAQRIRRRTRDGMRRAASRGRPLSGLPPFGYSYDLASNSWSVSEHLRPWVLRIFEDCAAGKPSRHIASVLAAHGIRSSRGGRWHATSIARLVKNTIYVGEYVQTVEGEEYRTEVPPIVDPALFRRANAALTARSGRPQNAVEVEALCRSVLFCGTCGERMQVRTSRRKGVAYVYYQCGSKHPRTVAENCGAQNHRVEHLDRAVWASVAALMSDPDLLAQAASTSDQAEERQHRERDIELGLEKLRMQQAEVLELLADGLAKDVCRERLKRLDEERVVLEAELERSRNAETVREQARLSALRLQERVQAIQGGLESASFELRRELLLALVPQHSGFGVHVHDTGQIRLVGALDLGSGGFGHSSTDARRGVIALR